MRAIYMQNTTPNTLAEITQVMKKWRAQKKCASEKMPDTLRTQILEMLAKYPQSTVAQALRLSNSTIFSLRKTQNTYSLKQTATPLPQQADVQFIPFQLRAKTSHLPDAQATNTTTPSVAMCKIMHPNGAKLIINSNDLNTIIQAFLCCK